MLHGSLVVWNVFKHGNQLQSQSRNKHKHAAMCSLSGECGAAGVNTLTMRDSSNGIDGLVSTTAVEQKQHVDVEHTLVMKSSSRLKSDAITSTRCNTVLLVLENPSSIENVGAILRSAEVHNIAKVYIVTGNKRLLNYFQQHELGRLKNRMDVSGIGRTLSRVAKSAEKWLYVRCFLTTTACLEHLRQHKWTSIVTSPHIKGIKNLSIHCANFRVYPKLAIWFGNESKGATEESLAAGESTLQIPTWGRVESLNVASAAAIVLYEVVKQRRNSADAKS